MVAMETGHFLKTLNDASLASLGFLMWKVLGCIICKNPLWVLQCTVNHLRCQTMFNLTISPLLLISTYSWRLTLTKGQINNLGNKRDWSILSEDKLY